jgi:hypothetical protein
MTNRLELNWKLDGFVDEQRYYCSETAFTFETKPMPKAVLAGDVRTYVDNDVDVDKVYYTAIGALRDKTEKLSNLIQTSTLSSVIADLIDGYAGFWIDPSDFSTLYQDEAGTIPVTAVNQEVRKISDKSQNNVSITGLGMLKHDDDGYYIDLSGAGYGFITSNVGMLDTVTLCTKVKATGGWGRIVDAIASRRSLYLDRDDNGYSFSASSGQLLWASATGIQQNTIALVTGLANRSPAYNKIRIDKAEISTNTSDQGSNATSISGVKIGSTAAGQWKFVGNIYNMLLVCRTFSEVDLQSIEAELI